MLRHARWLLLCSVLLLGAKSPEPRQVDLSADADQKRDELISEIQVLLPRIDADKKAELRFRLAEAYWEKSRFAYSREYARFDGDFQRWIDGGRKGPEPKLANYTAQTTRYRNDAMSEYQALINQYGRYERLDEVLFMLAFNQMESGLKGGARQNLARLIARYPKSTFAADANIMLGDDAFEANDVVRAQAAYQKAYTLGLASQKTATFVYALYKLAWCDFNQHNYEAALQKYKEVVRLSEDAAQRFAKESAAQKDAVQLQKEALSDVVKSFAQLGQVDEALAYFHEKARQNDFGMLTLRLAQGFEAQGEFAKAIKSYEALIARDPNNVTVASIEAGILNARAELNQYGEVVDAAKRASALCVAPKDQKACDAVEAKLREIVTKYHKFAQNDRYQKDYDAARALYEAYLPVFKTYPDHLRLAFYYADLLWDIGDYEKAATAYQQVIDLDHKGENAIVSAMNAILALEKLSRHEAGATFIDGRLVAAPKTDKAPLQVQSGPLSPAELALVKACDQYVALAAELSQNERLKDDIMQTRYKAAFLYQSHQLFDEANTRFFAIIKEWPRSKMARDAAILILDGDDARKDWAKLKAHSDLFAANPALLEDKTLAALVAKFQVGAAFNLIAVQGDKANPKDYELFAKSAPQSPLAQSARYNAFLLYQSQNKDDDLLRLGRELLQDPNAPSADSILLSMAKTEEKRQAFSEAASLYEAYATRFKTQAASSDALYNAIVLSLRSGQNDKAEGLIERYLKDNPGAKDRTSLLLSVAHINEDKANVAKAKEAYQRALKASDNASQSMQAAYALAQMDTSLCNDLIKRFDALSSADKADPIAKKGRAYCAFQAIEPSRRSFDQVATVNAKKSAMEKLSKAYLAVLDYGDDEWGIAALYEAASAQLDYVNALRKTPDPKGLDAESLSIFRQELENIVAPVESDALTALEKALARAFELKVYTRYTKALSQTLSSYYPSKLKPFVWTLNAPEDKPQENESLSRYKAEQDLLTKTHIGDSYATLGQWDLARHRSSAAAQYFMKGCDAGSLKACQNLGALALSFGDFQGAISAYQKAKSLDPVTPTWSLALGYALAGMGDSDKAIGELSQLVQKHENKDAFACLCVIYRNEKSDAQKALSWCDKYRASMKNALSDSDPMKALITSLESEVKASATKAPNGGSK